MISKGKYIQSLKVIVEQIKEDQKKLLTSNQSPVAIANDIRDLQNIVTEIQELIDDDLS